MKNQAIKTYRAQKVIKQGLKAEIKKRRQRRAIKRGDLIPV